MKKTYLIICLIGLLQIGCSSSRKLAETNKNQPKVEKEAKRESNLPEAELLDANTYKITEFSKDKTYGYTVENPIKVGGGMMGPRNEQRYLNALAGPKGEKITYIRSGSGHPFETENAVFGTTGFLDIYEITVEGSDKKITLYLNMYDRDLLQVPVGFTLKAVKE